MRNYLFNAVLWTSLSTLSCQLTFSLDPNAPPSKNFDLSHFKLQIPDKDGSEISTSTLNNGYQSQYFYTDKDDGSMTFYCPANGGTTPGTSYPRSELRHNCQPGNDHINWGVNNGSYSIYGRITLLIYSLNMLYLYAMS